MQYQICTPETHPNEVTYFGVTNFRNIRTKFGIKTDDRRKHMYIIGKTGMGKSTLLENMVIQDIQRGHGVAYVDPHGDTVEMLLNFIPKNRINDVVYFNPSDIDFPIAFNILESIDEPHQKNLVASGLVAVFKKLWADSWGPRLEYLLRNAILALLDYPGATLLGVTRILVDKEFRKKVIDKIKDPVVKSFWVNEYSKYSNQFQVEAISPIQNKVGQFLSMSMIRNIVGQVKSTIDIRDIMDNKKILLLNMSKGRMGEDAAMMLGATMITKMQSAAMSRVDMPEDERNDFYLYVDELQNFATESFANILSEARKYRLNLIMAHQYIEQLPEVLRSAVFGNVGTLVTFRVGAADAEFLGKEFMPVFNETDLVNLTKYDMYLKLMIDGVTSDPFSATGLPPLKHGIYEGNAEKIVKVSRERYAVRREIIEDKIARWSGVDENLIETSKKDSSTNSKKDEEGFKTKCWNCGKDAYTKFEPDGIRPVFCADCLKLFKEGKLRREDFVKKAPIKKQAETTKSSEKDNNKNASDKSKGLEGGDNTNKNNSTMPGKKTSSLSQAELSLAEALSKNPINFKGQPIKVGVQKQSSENKNIKKEVDSELNLNSYEKNNFSSEKQVIGKKEDGGPNTSLKPGDTVTFD